MGFRQEEDDDGRGVGFWFSVSGFWFPGVGKLPALPWSPVPSGGVVGVPEHDVDAILFFIIFSFSFGLLLFVVGWGRRSFALCGRTLARPSV